MDKLTEQITEERKEDEKKDGILKNIKAYFASLKQEAATDKHALAVDLTLFALGFVLSRGHLAFGAHPIGLSFIAGLPFGVWSALIGAVVGGLTLGKEGIIFAAASVIIVLLRAAISVSESNGGYRGIFHETLLLRASISVIGGFIAAVYEILLSGLNQTTMLFGLTMVLASPILTFVFAGISSAGIDPIEMLTDTGKDMSLKNRDRQERYNLIYFWLAVLALVFFVSISFGGVSLLGISASCLFAAFITLITAKRFGAVLGMATGFVSAMGISPQAAVGFALAGLLSGGLFGIGVGYAVIAGGAALCAWSSYSEGLGGLLSTLPEYLISATMSLPLLKKINKKSEAEEEDEKDYSSEDMVGTMALAYQNRYCGRVESLDTGLCALAEIIRDYETPALPLTAEDYREIIMNVAKQCCSGCAGNGMCEKENIRPCLKNADKLSEMLIEGKQINPDDVNTDTEFCQMAGIIAENIRKEATRARMERLKRPDSARAAEEYQLISGLINGARLRDEAERAVDNSMTGVLNEAFECCGFEGGTIRVFGERKRHFILAAEDEGGNKITSAQLRKSIEKAAGVRLGTPEYFRRGRMVLMECGIKRKYSVSAAIATLPGNEKEVSGDTATTFESSDDYFYSLISDGMGSGRIAKDTSEFVCKFMRCALDFGADKETMLHILNHTIKSGSEECSATVDLFRLDLLNGEAVFLKSGAAPSYVKRGSSIFRIRSQTAPIGLLSTIDSERIKVDVRPGDHIIMLSDGIADSSEDAPWLLLLLGEEAKCDLREYAGLILSQAVKRSQYHDDMSVIVLKVEEAD